MKKSLILMLFFCFLCFTYNVYAKEDVKKYKIVVSYNAERGEVSPRSKYYEEGTNATFTIKPNEGCLVKQLRIDELITPFDNQSSYTFTNIKDDHKISVTFADDPNYVAPGQEVIKPQEELAEPKVFDDVHENDWFYSSVNFVVTHKLFNGTSETEFSPNGNLTRGMLVTVLYRLSKSNDSNKSYFDDVDPNMYYSEPIAWASANSIVNGIGNNLFGPDNNITKQDLICIVYRYVKSKNENNFNDVSYLDLSQYPDYTDISSYALTPMKWAISTSLIRFEGNNSILPNEFANRAETAYIMERIFSMVNN